MQLIRWIGIVGGIMLLSTTVRASNHLPQGFVYLEEVIPGVSLDIRYASRNNFVGERLDGYMSARCILTREAAEALKRVQTKLKAFDLGIKIYDCYRPQRAVKHILSWAKDLSDTQKKARFYPGINKKELISQGYIAERSSHSRGSTVDLTIVSLQDGRVLDMGTPWGFFSPTSWPSNMTFGPQQRAHRMLLQTLMVQYGFLPLREEWWHFTLDEEPFPDTYFNFPVK